MTNNTFRMVDSHIHQWDPHSTPRDWRLNLTPARLLPPVLDLGFKLLSRADRESIADPVYLAKPYLPEQYRADIDGLQIDTVVHVESGWRGRGEFASVDETRWIASLPFEPDGLRLGAIVAAADPTSPNFAQVLDAHLDASPLVRGIRSIAAHHQDKAVRSWTSVYRLLVQPRFLDGFAKLAERKLTFDTWVYAHDLPDVAELAIRYPEVTIVLDNIGTPAGVFGPVGRSTGRSEAERRALLAAWRDDLAAVAQQPNVVVKLTGLALPVLGHRLPLRGTSVPVAELAERVAPLVDFALDQFGSTRTMWGSNSPMEKPVSDPRGVVEAIRSIIAERQNDRSASEHDDVFGRTAERVYGLNASRS
ncbi:amidohydrolase family protein [Antrihabitans stalagmiti]|nr:amidohydrolase family protein [Antrihabitans stalagmiti]